jgi:hypothetical protein
VLEVLVELGAFVYDGAARLVCGPAAAGGCGGRRHEKAPRQPHFDGGGLTPTDLRPRTTRETTPRE